jgi:hypothetical protein
MHTGRLIAPMLLLTLSAAACTEGESRTKRAKAPAARKLPSVPPLPKVSAPEPVAAERVVDLFYTSNVGGEADPCG